MLKQCFMNVDLSRLHAKPQQRPKCGEIFFDGDNEYCSFQFVCCLCEMKHFDFEDFSMHIRNVHLDDNGKPSTHTAKALTVGFQEEQLNPNKSCPSSLHKLSANDFHEFLSENDSDGDVANYGDDDDLNPLQSSESDDEVKPKLTTDAVVLSDVDTDYADDDDDDIDYNDDDNSENERLSVFKKKPPSKDYKCQYCGGKYTTLNYLNLHLKMRHPHPKAFKCNDCDATFDVDRALETHRRKMHTQFTCNQCNKVYKSSRTLLRHLQGHSGLRQYKCEYENCGKAFVSQHNLASHRRTHSTDRNYVCELCGYRSRYRFALVVHRRSHTGEKPFKCATCSRCFASKSLLNEHQAMHATDRPHKCDQCAASFSRAKALYHHKHLHLGIKKFKCKMCGKAYAQAAGLSAHMRGHKSQTINGIFDAVTTTPMSSSTCV